MTSPRKIMGTLPMSPLRERLKRLFRKKGRGGRLLKIFVYFPTALLALYLFVFFSDMYVSESQFAVRSSDGLNMPSVAGLLFQTSSSTILDAFIVQEHITSMDMLEKVGARIDLRKHFSDRSRDIYSRLKEEPTREEELEYWRWIVSAAFDLDRGFITVKVKAYTPEMAKAISDAILACSEELVNQMNDRAHQDALRLSREEVALAEKRLVDAQIAMQRFRDDKSILDPSLVAQGLEGVIATLEAEAAQAEAELLAALRVMRENSPRVQILKTKLQALREQLVSERARLSGLDKDGTLSSVMGDYTQLITEEKFAQEQLVTAMSALESARLRAVSQSRYIVPFQPPTLPQEATYPRPVLFTIFGFFAMLILLGICSLIIAAIKDHMEV
ncbi:capsule biosynthesis protein [Desulfovibrio sp. OttesenSCG-928-A18]|nr:capsule biosynthesis protein [Desulfovibrio sp. OttesenSCG-928-A18]